jgi:S1-C subfamily serine protease
MAGVPVLIANIVAAIAIVVLLLPGVRGAQPIGRSELLAADAALSRNEQLSQEIAALERKSATAVCSAEDAAGASGDSKGLVPGTPLPPVQPSDPLNSTVEVGGEDLPLVDLIERSVVMIIAKGQNASGNSLGSGFLIDRQRVVTNQHVVGDETDVLVVNKRLGRILPAKVVARTDAPARKGELDLAVLEMSEAPGELAPLPIASSARKLQSVVSAGYPGFLLQVDSDLQRLVGGDLSAAPEMIMNDGVVRRPGQASAAVPFILHSADIAQGNSGGPLVDACGQVLGVNTLTQADGEENYRTGWALASEALLAFLASKGIAATVGSVCQPVLAADQARP